MLLGETYHLTGLGPLVNTLSLFNFIPEVNEWTSLLGFIIFSIRFPDTDAHRACELEARHLLLIMKKEFDQLVTALITKDSLEEGSLKKCIQKCFEIFSLLQWLKINQVLPEALYCFGNIANYVEREY